MIAKTCINHMRRIVNRYVDATHKYAMCKRRLTLAHNIIQEEHLGKSPPVILIHGLLGNKRNFNFVSKLLQESLQNTSIITCDVRNHGDSPHSDVMHYSSMSDDILELLQQLQVNDCFLVGHSLGGRIAMHVALSNPEKVKRLIVVDVAPGQRGELRSVSKGAFEYIKAMKSVNFDDTLPSSKARMHVEQQLMTAIPERSIRQFVLTNLVKKPSGEYGWRVNVDGILQNRQNISAIGRNDDFILYGKRTLFIGGERSDYINSNDIPEIKRLFPNSIINYIPGCGHWVHADDPHAFSEMVSSFIMGPDE